MSTAFDLLQSALDDGPITLPVKAHKSLLINGHEIEYWPGTTFEVQHEPGIRTWIIVGGAGLKAHLLGPVGAWVAKFEIDPNTAFACGTFAGTPFREKINLSFGGG